MLQECLSLRIFNDRKIIYKYYTAHMLPLTWYKLLHPKLFSYIYLLKFSIFWIILCNLLYLNASAFNYCLKAMESKPINHNLTSDSSSDDLSCCDTTVRGESATRWFDLDFVVRWVLITTLRSTTFLYNHVVEGH